MKRLIFTILIAILLLTMIACDKENETTDLEIGFEVGDLAFDFEVEDSDGEIVKLSDFRGKKVLVVAWTSTWVACIKELSEIREVHEEINSDDTEILIVNLSNFDFIDSAKLIIEEESLEEISYYDINNHLENYNIMSIPASFYIDSEGVIVKTTLGADSASKIIESLNNIKE